MPGKKRKRTRSGLIGCPPCELPDISSCFTNSDIISALKNEILKNASFSVREAASCIKEKVVDKFKQINPRIVLLEEKSILYKMTLLYDDFQLLMSNKLKASKKTKFQDSLSKIFDIIKCKCKIFPCGGARG